MKNNTTLLLVGIIVSLGLFIGYQTNRLKLKDIELASAINNKEFYESLTSKTSDKNRVLQLTVDRLRTTNDSVL
jgi:predicted negative regulator of RcsB-dependent stress response